MLLLMARLAATSRSAVATRALAPRVQSLYRVVLRPLVLLVMCRSRLAQAVRAMAVPCRLLLAPHPVLVALAALRALPAVLALLAALCLYLPVQAQPMVVVLHPFLAAMPPKAMLAPYVSRVAPVLLVLVAR